MQVEGKTNIITKKGLEEHDTAQVHGTNNKTLGLGHVRRFCLELSVVWCSTVDLVDVLAYDSCTHKLAHAPRDCIQRRNKPTQLHFWCPKDDVNTWHKMVCF